MYPQVQQRNDPSAVIGRSCLLGLAAGAAIGGLVGTLVFPGVLTFGGALVGAAAGSAVGLANGFALVPIAVRTPSFRVASAASALVTLICILAAELALDRLFGDRIGWAWLIAPIAAGVAAVLGPVAAHGTRRLDPPSSRRRLAELIRRIVIGGVVAGAAVGAVAATVVGLFTYAPTAAFALVEGAVLGCGCGVVGALVVSFALICSRLFGARGQAGR